HHRHPAEPEDRRRSRSGTRNYLKEEQMTNPVSISGNAAQTEQRPHTTADAARQFEALLISQILKAACDPASMTGGEPDSGECTAIEMAQEQFAACLASQGGLGLARMISSSEAMRSASKPSVEAAS